MQEIWDIGIDVAKVELVVHVAGQAGQNRTVANAAESIQRWLDGVPADSRLAVESTGIYHQLVASLAQARGLSVYVLNACDVHHYARAIGRRGKTDRVDAQVISRYLREHHAHLHPYVPGTAAQQRIHELLQRRGCVVTYRDGLRQSLRGEQQLIAQVQALTEQFDQMLQAIDAEVMQLIGSDTQMAELSQRLRTVPGIGQQGGAMLACLFSRISFANADAAVAFSGLDPRPKDSGQKHGVRRLSKRGPPLLRRTLFMMAFSASRTQVFKPIYFALRRRGFSSTEAFVILGRKLLRIAYALWKTKTSFDATRWVSRGV